MVKLVIIGWAIFATYKWRKYRKKYLTACEGVPTYSYYEMPSVVPNKKVVIPFRMRG